MGPGQIHIYLNFFCNSRPLSKLHKFHGPVSIKIEGKEKKGIKKYLLLVGLKNTNNLSKT